MLLFQNFDTYKAFLTEHFGEGFYADDNSIVDGSREDQDDVATLWVVAPGRVRIDYTDDRPSKIVPLPGCRH